MLSKTRCGLKSVSISTLKEGGVSVSVVVTARIANFQNVQAHYDYALKMSSPFWLILFILSGL